jgi:hypothetical protein
MEVDRIANYHLRFDGKRHYIGCPIGTLGVSLRGKSSKISRRLNFALTHMRQFYQDAFLAALSLNESSEKEKTALIARAADLADRFHLSLQGLSTLGKVQGTANAIKQLSTKIQLGL